MSGEGEGFDVNRDVRCELIVMNDDALPVALTEIEFYRHLFNDSGLKVEMAKRKDAPSSVLTRSGRETSTAIQASTNPLNTRKSPRFEKQMGPTPSTIKKKPEQSEKHIGSTPLRRSGRGKKPVDVPASKVKSTKKSADISEESAEDGSRDSNGGIKKRKRYNAVEFTARYKPQRVRVETEGSEALAHIESPSSSGDQFWSAAVGNGTPVANETVDGNADSLYQHLIATVSELCDILKFSVDWPYRLDVLHGHVEGAKIIVERFLKFVVGNFNVSKEHTNILQALLISVCWICSSLLEHTIDREKSFTLAKEHLNFSCTEEEADQVYEKLKKPKEMFLQSPMNLKLLNAFKDRASRPEEPRMSPVVPINPHEQKRENHGSSNEEALQSSGQILEVDIARKQRNEIGKFDREWREKKMNIVNEFELEKTLIRYLHGSNSSVRSEKLNLVEKEFADKMNEHERSRQVVVNDEISLNGPAHETQIVDLVESEKEDQESCEVAPALLGNPIEAESHDKPVHDLSPVVVPDGVVNGMVSGSHTSEKHMSNATVSSKPIGEAPAKQDADMVNDVARADTRVLSEPIGDIPAKHVADMGNDMAGADANVLSEPIGDIPAIEDIASEQQDEVANVVSSETSGDISAEQDANMENDVAGADAMVSSETIDYVPDIEESALEQDDEVENVVSGDDAMVLTEPIGDIPAKQHTDMEIDVAGQDASLELEVPEVDFNKENAKGEGTSSPDGSHAVEARSETGRNDLVPDVDVVEMEIPAINNLRSHADSADGSHAVEDPSGTGSNDVVLHAEAPVVGIPVGHSMASNVDSTDESSPVIDPNATGPNDIASHVNTGEMEILADNDTAPPVDSAADGSNAGEDGNETAPNDMAPRVDPCEMNMPAVNDVTPNVDSADGSHAIQDPPNETGLYGMSQHVDSDETGMPADIDMSHAVEDPSNNGSKDTSLHADSDQMGIPAANDLIPHIESADGSHADEDSNGTGPNHVAPNVEPAELEIQAANCNQENAQDTTPSLQQVASPVFDHSMPAIPEIHTDSHLLQQPSENGIQYQEGQADPTPMVEIEDDIMQPVEAIQVDQIIPEVLSLSPHDEPSSAISTHSTITENQAAMPSTSEVLAQTTAPPITAQAQIQLEQYMFDLLRNANSNQAGSRMTRRVDPLRIELEQLSSLKEKMVKSYHDNILKMNIDCEKEIAEAIAEIRLKYCNKRQEADATYNSQKKEVENNMNTVVINQVLAATFRRKCQDVSRGCAAVQQAFQAESMQQQRRFRGSSTCLPGQSSGTQQTPPPPPPPIPATAVATPPQQPSAIFSTPLRTPEHHQSDLTLLCKRIRPRRLCVLPWKSPITIGLQVRWTGCEIRRQPEPTFPTCERPVSGCRVWIESTSWQLGLLSTHTTLDDLDHCIVDDQKMEWPLKSKLDREVYGPPESAITTEIIQQVIGCFISVEQ
ncbi:P-loop containing nucleoside triphosphate hydrolase, partial [Tanacetum coccineum]